MQKADDVRNNRLKPQRGIDLINRVNNEPEPIFLWHGVPEGSKGLIAGAPKTGKTTLAENLAISICVGKKQFLGYDLDGVPKRVLFINMEETYKLFSRRNAKQISQLSESEKKLFEDNYMCAPDDFPEFFTKKEDWKLLRELIIDSKAEVVFIDSLTHLFDGEIERSVVATKFIENFRKSIKGLNITIVLIHHTTKDNEGPFIPNKVAGSRVILQEFEYIVGLATIPTSTGGRYLCMGNNKHIAADEDKAILYELNEYGWTDKIGEGNKYNLHKESFSDGRTNSVNLEIIYNYFESQTSQTSQTITTSVLKEEFVQNSTMSKETLHQSLNKLIKQGKIIKESQGNYKLVEGGHNE